MRTGTQVAARLERELTDFMDGLVADGRFASRADVVRYAVDRLYEAERRRAVGESIVDGYRRVPQPVEEVDLAERNLRRLLAEETW